jgi:hypothetical protein
MHGRRCAMTKALLRGTATAVILLIAAAAIIYATAKPYQQDRIMIEMGLKAR